MSGASSQRPQPFSVMVKPRGSICNLECAYCYYLKKERLYPGASFRMADEQLEAFTRQYIAALPAGEATFAWQGGEPALMGLAFFERAVELQQRYRRPGIVIRNTFQTNATLLTEEWCDFFAAHDFLVGVSLDGPRELHDAFRKDKGGQPSFDRAMRGLDLLKRRRVAFNTLTCVHAANAAHGLEVYRFLRDEVGSQYIQFIPIVERDTPDGAQMGSRVTPRSVTGPRLGSFLIEVFDEWARRDVGRTFVQWFDAALAAWVGQPSGLCVFDAACGNGLALEFNGDVFACDHYVEPGYRLGNLAESDLGALARSARQAAFGAGKSAGLPAYCRACEALFACHGGCPKDRLLRTPEGEPGLNALCAGYRSFFNYARPAMKYMAALLRAGKPAADVMPWLADSPPLARTPGEADCPCGSGRAAAECHARPGGYIPLGLSAAPPAVCLEKRKRH